METNERRLEITSQGKMSNNILIIIPARGGSKRFPGKHIKPLVGRNLLERPQDVIAAAELDSTIHVSRINKLRKT